MLRLCHVLEATEGGTRRHLEDLVAGLPRAEFAQRAIVAVRRDPSFAAAVADWRRRGVPVTVLPLRRRLAPWSDLAGIARLAAELRRRPCDVLHLHSSKAGFLGRIAARLAGCRAVLYTPHAFAFQRGGLSGRLFLWLEKLVAPLGAGIAAVSPGEAELARRHGLARGQPVAIVPNGLDAAWLGAIPERPAGFPPRPLIGLVGRLVPQKDPLLLAAAAPAILAARPGVRFRVVGSGPLAEPLRRQVARAGLTGCFEFQPAAAARDPAAYAGLDLLVLPSRYEGLPYVLLEALALGLPVAASRVPGVGDVVEDGVTGLLFPPGDAAGLAGAVARLLGDCAWARRLGRAGAARVRRDFTLAGQLAALARVYRAAAAAASPNPGLRVKEAREPGA